MDRDHAAVGAPGTHQRRGVGLGIEVSIAVGAVIGFLIANVLLYQDGGRATR